jgi:redox-sensing transcriptional repressor
MQERFGRRIPEPTVVRLPVYQRVLSEFDRDGLTTVSSAELAEACGVNAAKVRKDLSYFGSYGTRGTGYDVEYLLGQIQRELGIDLERPVVIAGMGHLGHALARSPGFAQAGFRIVGMFDIDSETVGEILDGIQIRHLTELEHICRENDVSIGVITTPAAAAQDVCDKLASAGVSAILNFAPTVLTTPLTVRHVDFSAELQVLAFYQAHPEAATGRAAAVLNMGPEQRIRDGAGTIQAV